MNLHDKKTDNVDMTPMVDVTFLLLVFFMVTSAFVLQRSFVYPSAAGAPADRQLEQDQDVALVTVTIDKENSYRVASGDWEDEAPSVQDLHISLRAARQRNQSAASPTALLVRASGDALHENVVAAFDAGMQLGMHDLRLETLDDD